MDNYYVSKLIPLIREAGVAAIANPLINIMIQGRHDTYPKRRGMTRVPELLEAGVPVAFGQDCVMDPWYSLGSGDMLDVAHMGLHVAQMTGPDAMHQAFLAVTETPARILGLEGYGLARGCNGDFVRPRRHQHGRGDPPARAPRSRSCAAAGSSAAARPCAAS